MEVDDECDAEAGTLSSDVDAICEGGSVDLSLTGTSGDLGYVIFQNEVVIAVIIKPGSNRGFP
ncbi:MAG: hypothetical protein IPJ74_03485 [Saprospiraceae bacterium]|nr:hypothetical protein [Saprospiraceae bacterium]